MRLYFDLDSQKLSVNLAGSTPEDLVFKKGDQMPISFVLVRNNVPRKLDGAYTLTFGLKVTPHDAQFVAKCDTYTYDSVHKVYNGVLNLNTTELDTAMTDLDQLEVYTELTYVDQSAGPVSSNTLRVNIYRDIVTGNEGTPTSFPNAEDWLTARAVRYDITQMLFDGEKQQARDNIGAVSSADLAGYQPLATTLTTLSGLTPAADRYIYFTGSSTAALGTITAFGRSILDDEDAATVRSTISAQTSNSNLTGLSALSGTGIPYDAAGTWSLLETSTGGNGIADALKVARYSSPDGSFSLSKGLVITDTSGFTATFIADGNIDDNRVIGIPNGEGILALTSQADGLITSVDITDRSSGGHGTPDGGLVVCFGFGGVLTATSTFTIGSDAGGNTLLVLDGPGAQTGTIQNTGLTAYRTYDLPDGSGWLALTPNADGSLPGSYGGNGADDLDLLARYGSTGELKCSEFFSIISGLGDNATLDFLKHDSSGGTSIILNPSLPYTAGGSLYLPEFTSTGDFFAAKTSQTDGSISLAKDVTISIVTKTATYTATSSDHTILCDATGGAFTVNLPAASASTGRIYAIKKIDSSGNAITIDGNGSETIDGSTTKVLSAQWNSFLIQSNGTNWFILAS